MNILLISYSGRKGEGNCIRIMSYIKQLLVNKKHQCNIIELKNLKINSCLNCNYECFIQDGVCPKNDDVKSVYDRIICSDITIFVVPVYSSAPPAIYFALRERSQFYFTTNEKYQEYQSVEKGYIIIGNKAAGGNEAMHIIQNEDKEKEINSILIQSSKYKQRSIKGNLIKFDGVKEDVNNFIIEFA